MTDGRAGAELDARRKRAVFRAWHRGIKEMDLILGRFADAEMAGFSDDELARFEALMLEPDPVLYAWVTGAEPIPAGSDFALIKRIADFHLSAAT